ncbi:MAG: metallophosphoesterase [Gemmatimonadota bacterium]
MTRNIWLTALALLLPLLSACQGRRGLEPPAPQEIETSVFLVGDAGEPNPRQLGPALRHLSEQVAAAPDGSVVLFLGDNIYPEGVPQEGAPEWADARRRLRTQIQLIPPGVRAIFMPGNHDWGGGPFGLYSLRTQEAWIAEMAGGRDVSMVPSNGCPGPVPFDVGRLRMVILDTQWWLHDYIVRDERSNCDTNTSGQVTAALREQVRPTRDDQIVMVAGHHPLVTGGRHGGYCGITGPFQRFAGRSQDIMSSANRTMRDSLESAFSAHPPLIYASGHEHTLQVLRGGRSVHYLLVSGSASKRECAVKMRESYYVSQNRHGFMRVDLLRDGSVWLGVYRYTGQGEGEGGLSYARLLNPRR